MPISGWSARTLRQASRPLPSGSRTSRITTSGLQQREQPAGVGERPGLAGDLEVAVALERAPQALADQLVIVDEEHADRHDPPLLLGCRADHATRAVAERASVPGRSGGRRCRGRLARPRSGTERHLDDGAAADAVAHREARADARDVRSRMISMP